MPYLVAPGLAKHLTLDFDLKASNTVIVLADSASIVLEQRQTILM